MGNNIKVGSNDYAGLLIGFNALPGRSGFEYVLDHCEESGRDNKALLSIAKSMIGKKCYFYIFALNPADWDDEKILDDYLNSQSSIIHGGKKGIFEKIFGEGLIENAIQKNDGQYIIFKYVTHYREYVDIDDVQVLSKRIDEINKNSPVKSQKSVKQRIRLGLQLTNEECNQISKLAGMV